MKNIKKSYIIIGILLLVAIAGLLFMLFKDTNKEPGEKTTSSVFDFDEDEYLTEIRQEKDIKTPLMQTDIEDVFYTMDTRGQVEFFKYDGNSLKEIDATGSYEIKATSSRQNIPATVYYYKEDQKITGFGLFTTEISDAPVLYYDYAFFRLMNMPATLGSTNNYLLLIDTNKENFFLDEKVYEEPFEYNPSTNSAKKLLYDANRILDMRGAYRQGYHMITTDLVKEARDYLFFFSSRHYHLTGEKMDIFRSGEAGYNNRDNARRAIEVADFYCRTSPNNSQDFYFLKNTETGFDLMLNTRRDSEGDELIKSFAGSYAEDYIRYKDYLFEKVSKKLTNLASLEELTINFEGKEDFVADTICVSESGRVFLRGFYKSVPTIVIADTENDHVKVYHNEDFSFIINPIFLPDDSLLVSIAKDIDGSQYKYVIFA